MTEDFGEEWIEINAFLYLGIVLFETGKLKESLVYINKALLYADNQSAEAHYYKAQILIKETMSNPYGKYTWKKLKS